MRKLTIALSMLLFAMLSMAQQQINIQLKGESTPHTFFITEVERIFFDVHYDNPSLIGLEAVDLGLPSGVKWANIDYFTEEEGSKDSMFPWPRGSEDVVTTDWGSKYPNAWRMPTKADFEELLDEKNCVWTYNKDEGGFVVTSTNPAYKDKLILRCNKVEGDEEDDKLDVAYYWTSTISTVNPWYLSFYWINNRAHEEKFLYDDKAWSTRMAIRPVFGKAIPPKKVTMTTGATTSGRTANIAVTYAGDYADVTRFGLLQAGSQSELATLTGDNDANPSSGSPGIRQTFALDDLEAGTYSVMPYVYVGSGYQYGSPVDFTIDDTPVNTKFPIPAAGVNLGLPSGILWSPYNFGYANETDTVSHFYGWGDPTGELKDLNSALYAGGEIINDITTTKYDIARTQWGSEWRLPQRADWEELYKYCDFVADTRNGMNGYVVKNKTGIPDNSIFIPQCGVKSIVKTVTVDENGNEVIVFEETKGTELRNSQAFYWTSEQSSSEWAYRLRVQRTLSSDNFETKLLSTRGSIRPVYGPVQGSSTPVNPGDESDENLSLEKDLERSNDITAVPKAAVDMGLPSGIKWAAWNVGAQGCDDLGRYYAWGETEEKSTYSNSAYTSELKGKYADDIDKQYDVARQLWGNKWRMPTYNDYDELFSVTKDSHGKDSLRYVTLKWDREGEYNGLRVTSRKKPGNSIFFPAGGYKTNGEVDKNRYGRYWTGSGSSANGKETTHAEHLRFGEIADSVEYEFVGLERFIGCLVRPIYWIDVTELHNDMGSTELTVKKGETFTLNYTVLPTNATNRNVSYVIGNSSVVSRIGTSNRFNANNTGSTTIRVITQDSEYVLTYTVTVTE